MSIYFQLFKSTTILKLEKFLYLCTLKFSLEVRIAIDSKGILGEIEIANFVQVSFVEITVSYLRRKTCCELHATVSTKVAVKRGRTNTMNKS